MRGMALAALAGTSLLAAALPLFWVWVYLIGLPIASLFFLAGIFIHDGLARRTVPYHWTVAPLICAAIFGGLLLVFGIVTFVWGSGFGTLVVSGEQLVVDGRLTSAGTRLVLVERPVIAAAFGAFCGAVAWVGAFGFVRRHELRV